MKRRVFLQHTGRALAVAPLYSVASGLLASSCAEATPESSAQATAQSIPAGVLERIGITTVCFRSMFPKSMGLPGVPGDGGTMTLLEMPKFIVDNLGIRNLETWNWQFAETSMEYCASLKASAEAAGARWFDLQLDLGPEDNLSDVDPAKRAATIATMKQWMDRTAALGATSMRANTGGGPAEAWDPNRTAEGFRQLAEYGQGIGVKVLIENHIGYSAEIDKVVEVMQVVNHPNVGVICDWGNTPDSGTIDEKVAALSTLFPYLYLVSAKQLDFDDQNQHISYDILPIIEATEASGFKGIYSIEFYSEQQVPRDDVAAARTMRDVLAANITAA
jgi:sugar phosphate isomerase/epimerase